MKVATKQPGEKVKELRVNRGMTRQALADAAGLTRMSVYRIELGRTEPELHSLRLLARALGVEVKELV